jgi:DNA invertase Pin-like site-specific DNA recombinase
MNGVIYCRVSSKEQVEGTSLQSQEAACRDFAKAKNIKVLRVFVEQGESAKFADRTQLVELIDFCRTSKGGVQVLIVWKVDRFARNVADHYSVKATLAKHGVGVVSVTEPIDANPEGRLMETILAGFAQFDNDIRAIRTVQGMRRKIKDGIPPWGPPMGYVSAQARGEKKTMPDKTDPRTFALLQKAWREYATGAYTRAEIGRRMLSWGLAGAHGRAFGPETLYRLFTNPYYAGILIDPWDGSEHEGRHVPMVSRAEFAQVQQVIHRRNKSVRHQKEHPDFPLRGSVRCTECLHYMTSEFSQGRTRRYAYYLCLNKSCDNRGHCYAAPDLHEEFATFLDQVAPQLELVRALGEKIVRDVEADGAARELRRKRQRERVGNLDDELHELVRMRTQRLITDQEFAAQRQLITGQRNVVEARDNSGAITAAEIREDLGKILAPLTQLKATWRVLAPAARIRFERWLLPAGFVNGRIQTAELGQFFSALGGSGGMKSTEVAPSGVLSNHFDPRIIGEIRAFQDILDGVEPEKKVRKRPLETSRRAIPHMRFSNLKDWKDDAPPKACPPDDDPEDERKRAA